MTDGSYIHTDSRGRSFLVQPAAFDTKVFVTSLASDEMEMRVLYDPTDLECFCEDL